MAWSRAALMVAISVALSACTVSAPGSSSAGPSEGTAQSSPSSPSGTPTSATPSVLRSASPTPSEEGARLASGLALPACEPAAPDASDTVAFVAAGHAWALSPSGAHLTCLFAVAAAGPFEWGPLGDRVLLGGLEVKGVAGGPSLAAGDTVFATVTWSRPTGKSIVYAPLGGTSLEKLLVDGAATEDVTPLASSRYLSIAYHPSGEAYAFAVQQEGGESVWISTNTGATPFRLVFSTEGTRFGAIGFEVDGQHLLYAAQHADNHAELHRIDVTDTTTAPVLWAGPVGSRILDIQPGLTTGTVAWTTGSASCADTAAMTQTPAGTVRALPDATGPTRSIGWLGGTQLLVASGGCGGPLELSAVDVASGSVVPLVSGVSIAAVRTAVPTPPAPLPKPVAALGSGFS